MIIKQYYEEIANVTDLEIESIDITGNDIIGDSLKAIRILQKAISDIRNVVISNNFSSKEEEIHFFKEQKPELLSKLLYFNKLFQIESKFPNGSNDVGIRYLNMELDSLTFFFNKNLDFYQYYRSKSTIYDEYYFTRGKNDIRLNSDSSLFNAKNAPYPASQNVHTQPLLRLIAAKTST